MSVDSKIGMPCPSVLVQDFLFDCHSILGVA